MKARGKWSRGYIPTEIYFSSVRSRRRSYVLLFAPRCNKARISDEATFHMRQSNISTGCSARKHQVQRAGRSKQPARLRGRFGGSSPRETGPPRALECIQRPRDVACYTYGESRYDAGTQEAMVLLDDCTPRPCPQSEINPSRHSAVLTRTLDNAGGNVSTRRIIGRDK